MEEKMFDSILPAFKSLQLELAHINPTTILRNITQTRRDNLIWNEMWVYTTMNDRTGINNQVHNPESQINFHLLLKD